eukprot:5033056-Prymnesium_polylepis.1
MRAQNGTELAALGLTPHGHQLDEHERARAEPGCLAGRGDRSGVGRAQACALRFTGDRRSGARATPRMCFRSVRCGVPVDAGRTDHVGGPSVVGARGACTLLHAGSQTRGVRHAPRAPRPRTWL